MKFIALISGGKDSTFAIHECQRQGHELVALANLYPLEDDDHESGGGPDAAGDLDSWCFQTVGHGLVAAYARCCPQGVPLYRRATRGAARRKGLSYPPSRATPGDEVEDLAALLAFVASRHRSNDKEPLGVCTGAVASDYQRLRVEAVACGRLGLASLAPLWRRAQYPLLKSMDSSGVRAIIAKVAAAGLDPRRDLGKDVACRATRRRLAALRRSYGLNVCGEGGEYESLTLDAPRGVFPRGRVVLGGGGGSGAAAREEAGGEGGGGWRLVVTSEDAVAPGGALVPVCFAVVARDDGQGEPPPEGEVVEVPRGYEAPPPPPAPGAGGEDEEDDDYGGLRARVSVRASERHAVVGCRVSVVEAGAAPPPRPGAAAPEGSSPQPPEATARAVRLALRSIERAAAELLRQRGAAAAPSSAAASAAVWPRALFVHLLVRDMRHFAPANAAYCSVVPLLRPPARACVEAPLPEGCLLHADALLLLPPVGEAGQQQKQQPGAGGGNDNNGEDGDDDDDGAGGEAAQARLGRRVLHVQSISPWAPACIGPYSQAAADGRGGLLHLAGQIPLDPATMELLPVAAGGGGEGGAEAAAAAAAAGGEGAAGPDAAAALLLVEHTDRALRSCQAVAVAAGGRMDAGGCAGAAVYLSPQAGSGGAARAAAEAVAAFLRDGRTAAASSGAAASAEEAAAGGGVHDREVDSEEQEDMEYVEDYLRPLAVPRGRVRVARSSWQVGGSGPPSPQSGGGGERQQGGSSATDSSTTTSTTAACVYAVVPCLPRGALVEVQPTLLDLRAFAPGGGAGDPPSSSSSSSEEEEEEEAGEVEAAAGDDDAAVALLAASTGARAHLSAYSWLSRGRPPQRRLAARLLVALPLRKEGEEEEGGGGGSGPGLCRALAAAVATALREARRSPLSDRPAGPLNVASVRVWCTPEAFADLAGPQGEGEDDDWVAPFDAALAAAAGPLLLGGGGGGGGDPSSAGAQLMPALEVRCSGGGGGEGGGSALSAPCAAAVELVILH